MASSRRESRRSKEPTMTVDEVPSPTADRTRTQTIDTVTSNAPIRPSSRKDFSKDPIDLKAASGAHGTVKFNDIDSDGTGSSAGRRRMRLEKISEISREKTRAELKWFDRPDPFEPVDQNVSENRVTDADIDSMFAGSHDKENLRQPEAAANIPTTDAPTHEKHTPSGWFNVIPSSPGSTQDATAFFEQVIHVLENEPDVLALGRVEDEIHNTLRNPIEGKWTRRFIEKRTKPKLLNQLHTQRLEVLAKFFEKDRVAWHDREGIYVNLALRCRVHEEGAKSIQPIFAIMRQFQNEIGDIWGQLAEYVALWAVDRRKHVDEEFSSHHTNFVANLEALFKQQLLLPAVGDVPSDARKLQWPDPEKELVPNDELVTKLLTDLDRALVTLEGPMWQCHDSFKRLDNDVQAVVEGLFDMYIDAQENPLILEDIYNFPLNVSRVLSLIEEGCYYRRRLAALLPQLMPDFRQIDQVCTENLSQVLVEYCDYNVATLATDGVAKEEPTHDEVNVLVGMISRLDEMFAAADEFVKQELPETHRLLESQIAIEAQNIQVNGLMSVSRYSAFADLPSVHVYQPAKNSMQCNLVLSEQGVLWIFPIEDMGRVAMTVKLSNLDAFESQDGAGTLFLVNGNETLTLTFGQVSQHNDWLRKIDEFCAWQQ